MRDVIVVGAGIIGATVGRYLERQGLDVLVLDDGRPESGTRPSGGHLKPSWFGDMPKAEYVPAMDLLDEVWGLVKDEYSVVTPPANMVTASTVYRVDTDAVLVSPRTVAHVTDLVSLDEFPVVIHSDGEDRCRLLVVATGAWANVLIPQVAVQAKRGVSFRFLSRLDSSFVQPWAPYKQIVAHQQTDDQVWVGDGTALLVKSWDDGRTGACLRRCKDTLETVSGRPAKLYSTATGLRPYCQHPKSEPCLLRRIGPRAWVVTGAGKSGTIAAGWAAGRLLREIKG